MSFQCDLKIKKNNQLNIFSQHIEHIGYIKKSTYQFT